MFRSIHISVNSIFGQFAFGQFIRHQNIYILSLLHWNVFGDELDKIMIDKKSSLNLLDEFVLVSSIGIYINVLGLNIPVIW